MSESTCRERALCGGAGIAAADAGGNHPGSRASAPADFSIVAFDRARRWAGAELRVPAAAARKGSLRAVCAAVTAAVAGAARWAPYRPKRVAISAVPSVRFGVRHAALSWPSLEHAIRGASIDRRCPSCKLRGATRPSRGLSHAYVVTERRAI